MELNVNINISIKFRWSINAIDDAYVIQTHIDIIHRHQRVNCLINERAALKYNSFYCSLREHDLF